MKLLLIALIFSLSAIAGKSETIIRINNTPPDTKKTCNIIAYYGDFIKISRKSYEGKEYLSQDIVETPYTNCFSAVTNNTMYIDYLLTNFSSSFLYSDELQNIKDSLLLQKQYIDSLQKDTTFNKVMTELASKTINKTIPRDSITMDQMLDIAVKYFSIMAINKDGDYQAKVCTGMNDIKKTEKIKKPLLEAFCFSSIAKNYQGKKFNMMNEMVKSAKQLYKINLGIDEHERLLRAQGAMYFLMRNDRSLEKMLRREYKANKKNLPFILKD